MSLAESSSWLCVASSTATQASLEYTMSLAVAVYQCMNVYLCYIRSLSGPKTLELSFRVTLQLQTKFQGNLTLSRRHQQFNSTLFQSLDCPWVTHTGFLNHRQRRFERNINIARYEPTSILTSRYTQMPKSVSLLPPLYGIGRAAMKLRRRPNSGVQVRSRT